MESIKDYVIADHRIRLAGNALNSAVDILECFRPFLSETEGEPIATISLFDECVVAEQNIETLLYSIELEDGVVNRFGKTKDGFRFDKSGTDGFTMSLFGNKNENKWYIKGSSLDNKIIANRYLKFLLWVAFGLSTLHLDTVPIHSSTITYKGRNVLFLGESGTGKSTHTRLWRENIEGATLLNDDSPILRIKEDGSAWIYGSPWSGKTPCYKNESYPLVGCVRLSQAPYNKITRLRMLKAYAALHPSCPPDFAYDRDLYDCISKTISKLIGQVPVFHLECLPNADAAYLSRNTIFGYER